MCIHALAWHVKHSSQVLKKKKTQKNKTKCSVGKGTSPPPPLIMQRKEHFK